MPAAGRGDVGMTGACGAPEKPATMIGARFDTRAHILTFLDIIGEDETGVKGIFSRGGVVGWKFSVFRVQATREPRNIAPPPSPGAMPTAVRVGMFFNHLGMPRLSHASILRQRVKIYSDRVGCADQPCRPPANGSHGNPYRPSVVSDSPGFENQLKQR